MNIFKNLYSKTSRLIVVCSLILIVNAFPAQANELESIRGSSVPPLLESQKLPGYPAPVYHFGAPVPQPFSADYLVGYSSDISSYNWGIYSEVIQGFEDLKKKHPVVMEENLQKVVLINNEAESDSALIRRAQLDTMGMEDPLYVYSDALGQNLGRYFREALSENRLPKTKLIFGNGMAGRAGGLASSTVVEKMIFDNDRPFVVAPEKIRRYDDGVNNFYSDSKSFPSGQANQSAWFTMLMAMALPELGPQLLARSSEVGMNRLVMGVHYPLDIIGGRMTGSAAAADRWNDPKMRKAIQLVGQEIRSELEWRAGMPLADAIAQDIPYRSDEQAVQEYTKQLSMGFEVIYDTEAEMIVPKAAPDLLLPFFPGLNYNQRMEILRQTAISSGSPLDNQGSQGSWQRLNFALAMVSNVQLLEDGGIIVN